MPFVPRRTSRALAPAARPRRTRSTPRTVAGAVLVLVAGLLLPVLGAPAGARAATTDTLTTGQRLTAGQQLTSTDGRYRLALQTDGNLVLYAPGRAMWATSTTGAGNWLTLQGDGNLVLYTADGRAAWTTATRTGTRLQVQTDGNLVLYGGSASAATVAWASQTPPDTLAPGGTLTPGDGLWSADGRYRLTLDATGDVVVTAGATTLWRAGTQAASARLTMQADGNLVLYAGSVARWWTATDGHAGAVAVLRDGHLEITQGGVALWRSSSLPTVLRPGVVLAPGSGLSSPDGLSTLAVQTDGNLVYYTPGVVSWATSTSGRLTGLVLQADGNLVLYRADGVPLWSSGTSGTAPGFLQPQDDGHLVLYSGTGAPVWSMWARSPGITAAVAAAASFGAASGERTAVVVLDRSTRLVYGGGDTGGAFASASLVKVFIAARLLAAGAQADPATNAQMYRMITQSDDAAATALWPRAGGAGVTDWVQARYGITGLGHPTQAGWWGLTQIVPTAMVQFYAAVAVDPAVGPWLTDAMAHATQTAADGWNQWFGIPSATAEWKVKQGWMCCLDSRSRLHSTGYVGNGRYAVGIFTDGTTGYYGASGANVVTGMALRLLPNGRMPG